MSRQVERDFSTLTTTNRPAGPSHADDLAACVQKWNSRNRRDRINHWHKATRSNSQTLPVYCRWQSLLDYQSRLHLANFSALVSLFARRRNPHFLKPSILYLLSKTFVLQDRFTYNCNKSSVVYHNVQWFIKIEMVKTSSTVEVQISGPGEVLAITPPRRCIPIVPRLGRKIECNLALGHSGIKKFIGFTVVDALFHSEMEGICSLKHTTFELMFPLGDTDIRIWGCRKTLSYFPGLEYGCRTHAIIPRASSDGACQARPHNFLRS